MSSFSRKLYLFSCRFIQIFCLLLFLMLFAAAFLSTCYSTDMETQKVLTRWDNPLVSLPVTGLFCAVLFLLSRFFSKGHTRLLTCIVLLWCAGAGAVLILFGRTVPAADAMSIYSIAQALASGDTSVIHPFDSYLSYYPQQVGLTAFFEILIRFWNLLSFSVPAYHFIKCIYVLFACMIVLFQKKTVHLLWKDERADCLFLLLSAANLPFLMYTSFVYGEIPSFTAVTLGFYFLARLWKGKGGNGSWTYRLAAFALVFLTLSVMLRKNNLILVIAVLIVVFLQGIKDRRPRLLLWGIVCCISCLLVLPAVQKFYEHRADNDLSSGVTASSYFAMGMQESSRADGWYNGFNFNTYKDSGMDADAADEASLAAIRERLTYFKEHPGYAARFYLNKELSQWADPTYACRQATLATFGGRTAAFVSLYEGSGSLIFIEYCNLFQNVLYLGTLLFCIVSLRRKEDRLPLYLGLIGVVGGFLFHTIWEANSRYIFLYGMLLLPYAAVGLNMLSSAIPSPEKQAPDRCKKAQ